MRDLTTLHRRRDNRAAVDQRAGRDDHPARVLREGAGKSVCLGCEARKPRPSPTRPTPRIRPGSFRPARAPGELDSECALDVLRHLSRIPAFAATGHALDLT